MTIADSREPAPNARPLGKVDKRAFFDFAQKQPDQYRYEYVRGRIMQQVSGGTRRHARIAARFIEALSKRVDPERWFVLPSDLAVDTGPTIRYADVVVEPFEGDLADLATRNPAIIVEVLSKSSEDRDLYVKPAEYISIATLQAYIVASHDEPLCFLWMKDDTGQFPVDGIELRGLTTHIAISLLSSSIPLAEIYAGLIANSSEPGDA